VPKLRTYTDETEMGFINDELDAVYTAVEAIPTEYDLNDLDDVVITSPANNELLAYDTGGNWINQTPTEAGLDALYSAVGHDHDSDYAALVHDHDSDYAALVHTHTLLADRSVVSLGPGSSVHEAGITEVIGGANTDVGSLQFPDASTTNAVWTFRRPVDWDSGQIRITWWWSNMTASVSGNHYFAQRLTGWADGEDYSTPNGNQIIAGATTVTGLSNQGKIADHTLDDSGVVTLSNEDFFHYRIQRQGANGLDTSGQPWHLNLLTFHLIAI